MRVSSVCDQLLTRLFEGLSDCTCVCNDLLTVLLKGWCSDLLELNGKATDLVVVRASLQHREDGKVYPIKQFFLAENYAGAGTTKTLVRSGGHDIAVLERVVHLLRGNKTTDMRNISHEVRTDTVGNLAIACVIKIPRVATGATEENIWAELGHSCLKCVHVNETSLLVDKVRLADKVMAGS